MTLKLLALFLTFLNVITGNAQAILSGTIIDSKTQTGIPFVNVVLKHTGTGTSSDVSGNFSIKLEPSIKTDSMLFSAIGYQTLRKSVASILQEGVTTFVLKDTAYQLKAIVFEDTLKSAVAVIRNAMSNVKNNYYVQPHKLEAIFRIVDKENGKYVRMLESAINIYDPNFMDKNSRDVEYLAIRQTKDYRTFKWRMNNSNVRIAEDLLQPDLIKRPTRATHQNGFTQGFIYEFGDMTYLDGDEIYVIEVKKRPETFWANYDATFYVRVKDLAILRVERTYCIERAHWVDSTDVSTRITKDKLVLVYREHQGKLYLNYFSWELKGTAVNSKTNQVQLNFERWEELSVHHISHEKKPKKIRKAWNKDIYQMVEPYNEAYWQNYPTVNTDLFLDVQKELAK